MRIMGLDLGQRTIGVAVSDELHLTAQGVTVLRRRSQEEDLKELEKIKKEYCVGEVVVGLPKNMDGSLGPMGQLAREFAVLLEEKWSLPVLLWDERLSTVAAERTLLEGDMRRKKRKGLIDKTAAALILQAYLERRRNEKGRSVNMTNENNDREREQEGIIDFDPEAGKVILREANGEETGFFVECDLEIDGVQYIVLVPEEELEEDIAVVFRVEEDEDGNETWVAIEDEEEFARVERALIEMEEEEEEEE